MSILVGSETRLVVQGITGREGEFHTRASIAYGTKVVAGTRPGKGGQTAIDGTVPIFDTVAEAVKQAGANTSVIYIPAAGAPDAILEAVDAGIATIVCITEGIPALDMIPVVEVVRRAGARLIGHNCPGVTSPGRAKVGIIPAAIHKPGRVGVVSRSGTLTYEAVWQLTCLGLGQSTCVGIGGDPVNGTNHLDVLRLFEADPDTEAVIMIGEIGGTSEEEGAWFVKEHMTKPVAAYIAGVTAPPGKRMGHAGAIISGGKGTATEKVAVLRECGISVADSPAEMAQALLKVYRPDSLKG
jgi:succinyl-CoA synthetase alpha subunit